MDKPETGWEDKALILAQREKLKHPDQKKVNNKHKVDSVLQLIYQKNTSTSPEEDFDFYGWKMIFFFIYHL